MNRKTITNQTKADPFTLTLPDELTSITPKWTIELPGKHVGLVFDETRTDYARGDSTRRNDYGSENGESTVIQGYRYLVRRANGLPSKNSYYGRWAGHFFDNLLDLKLAIETDATALTPKTRTRRERDDYED